jgi:polyisoprenoid-binding protein YceI
MLQRTTSAALAASALLLAACGGDGEAIERAGTLDPAAPGMAAASGEQQEAAVRLTVAPAGNTARYRVREQLLNRDLPNDAVGETGGVTGGIALDAQGRIIAAASRFTVDMASMKTDSDRRDNYVRRRVLETEANPTVTLVPTAVRGLPAPLPSLASVTTPRSFQLVGDLTVRGVTRPTTWDVTAVYRDGRVTGTAKTAFTFAEFELTQPKVPVVLSVADTIRLEYDFTLVPEVAAAPAGR